MQYAKFSSVVTVVTVLVLAVPAAAQFGPLDQPGGPPEAAVATYQDTSGALPGGQARIAVVIEIPEGWHINAHEPLDKFLIPTRVTLEPPEGFTVAGMAYPEPLLATFSFSQDKMAVYEHSAAIGLVVNVADSVAPGEYALPGTLQYQACNDTVCAPPKTVSFTAKLAVAAAGTAAAPQHTDVFARIDFGRAAAPAPAAGDAPPEAAETASEDWQALAGEFTVTGRNSGYMGSDAFIEWVEGVESGVVDSSLNAFAGKSALAIVVLTLLGGLALNLTPCVLPLIPINLAIIGAGAQAGSRRRGFALGGVYGLAIALVYGILGIVAVLTGSSFGSINASPWFNLAIAVVFIVLALAMFDILHIDFTRFQNKVAIDKSRKGTFYLAFGMGAVSALLAGACVAPVVIFVILLARDLYQANPIALALPFLLGVGMALPWPFLGAGLSFLPKPGGWMVKVKYAFGVFILAFAAYYGYLSYELFSDRYGVDEAAVASSVEGLDEDGWTASLAEGLARAKAENKPVLVDFWATWCKNCLTMNQTTFKEPRVRETLANYIKVKYQAQQPDAVPARDVMEQFGVGGLGLPVYVILEPGTGG